MMEQNLRNRGRPICVNVIRLMMCQIVGTRNQIHDCAHIGFPHLIVQTTQFIQPSTSVRKAQHVTVIELLV